MGDAQEVSAAAGVFCRILDTLLPKGGCLVALIEAYFDESIGTADVTEAGTKRKVPVLCVAGYLIESEQAKHLCEEWQAVLDWKKLPFFHMVDCAHGNKPFDKLSKGERIEVASRMIGNIKRRTIKGFAVAVNVAQFEALMPQHPVIGSPYSFCATVVLAGVQKWIENASFKGDAAYFFEAGHASRQEADWIMRQTFDVPELRAASRYVAHSFVEKTKAPPLQAADLLAWQFYTDARHQMEGKRPRRKDFASLIQHPHEHVWITPTRIRELASEPLLGPTSAQLFTLFMGTKAGRRFRSASSQGKSS